MDRLTTQDDLQAGARWAPALRALGDERLARMVEGGSDHAFTAIYGRYAPILHGYCRSLLRDDDEAGDALQNAMLKALQAMRRAGRSGPLRPWLFRIAHNESVTILRARARRPGPLDEAMVAGAEDAFRRAAAREQLAALLEDMQHLTEHQRGALVMRELGGLTYDEIGLALETTPLAARQAVFVARKRLRAGVVAPRRLRPALRQLVPAPGFALFGLLGGGSAFTAGKALIGTAAAVSVGIGSVELAVQPPARQAAATRTTVAAAPTPHRTKRAPVAAAATATPTPARTAAAPTVRLRTVAARVTATPSPTARVIDTHARRPAALSPADDGAPDAPAAQHRDRPGAQDAPAAQHGDRPGVPDAPDPESAATTPAPAPVGTAVPVATRPTRPSYAGRPATEAAWSGAARDDRRDCPPAAPAADDTASPDGAAAGPVQ